MSDVLRAESAGPSAPNTLACGVDEAQAQVKTDTRQYTFSREFRSARLEQMYRAHAFKLGQRRISRLILLFVAFELYIIVSKYTQRPGMRTSVTQLFGPSAVLLSSLAFLSSKWNNPSRMPVLLWLLAVSYVSLILGPLLRDLIAYERRDHGAHREHVSESTETADGTSHNLTLDDPDEESIFLTGAREHDASWVVGCWHLIAFGTAVWGDSSGMGPAGCISLFWILAGFHATTIGLAYSWQWSMAYPDSDEHIHFGTFVPQLVTAGAINAYLTWIACEASRKMFLASTLASMQRMEQLSGEKERLDYKRQFAEAKLRRAWSNSPPHEREAGQEGSLEPEPPPGERSAERVGSESASSNSELRAISVAMRASKARTPKSASSNSSNSSDKQARRPK